MFSKVYFILLEPLCERQQCKELFHHFISLSLRLHTSLECSEATDLKWKGTPECPVNLSVVHFFFVMPFPIITVFPYLTNTIVWVYLPFSGYGLFQNDSYKLKFLLEYIQAINDDKQLQLPEWLHCNKNHLWWWYC